MTAFENIVEKGEIIHNVQFLRFQLFSFHSEQDTCTAKIQKKING